MSIRIFEEIYTLNRTRNEQILLQVKAINSTLNAAGISPIYLKGTGNLIDGIYNDIGERIIGDIDFLVPENDFLTTAECFKMRECREHQFKHHNFNKKLKPILYF